MNRKTVLSMCAGCSIFASSISFASSTPKNISELPIEQLSQVKVYSASKKSEDPDVSPSSVYVITQKDMRQMGVTHVADALRTVPGLHVAKLSSNKWMVSSRGFGEQFSNKLLVLIDGRPVYSTMYSGVYWDQQDMVLDNIKQIEVIRGPGATLWGANAVNGVINVITKNAKETQGNHLSLTYGDHYQGIVEARSGFELSDNEHMRASFKLRNHGDTHSLSGGSNNDEWSSGRADFRYDNEISHNEFVNIQGEFYRGVESIDYNLPSLTGDFVDETSANESFEGATLSGKWQYGIDEKSDIHIDGYINYDQRDFDVTKFNVLTMSINAQHDWKINDRNSLVWGGGYTVVDDEIDDSIYLTYTPDERTSHFFSLFAEHTLKLFPEDGVNLTLGSKFEHNSYSGFEVQPSTKLSWQMNKNDLLWASASRAVRTPSRGTHNLSLQGLGTPAGYVAQIGNSNFESEELIAFEAGYKTQFLESVYTDATVFYNVYDNLRAFNRVSAFGNIALPLSINNNGEAKNFGIELSAKYSPRNNLDFWLGYSFIKLDLDLNQAVADNTFLNDERKTPQQQASLRSQYRVDDNIFLNNSIYYIDDVDAINVKDYLKWDANIRYRFSEKVELILSGENLLDSHHQEYSAPLYSNASEVPRSLFGTIKIFF